MCTLIHNLSPDMIKIQCMTLTLALERILSICINVELEFKSL